ncbi:MAG: deoxyuridine 5'-triphosphate nucleotidohydrolase [Bacilli bacterium]|nr:deoxyuridine 5'-triphosphate nucleotidohydrolase [Bacilli bacterium]MDD4809081.1 deoxyuridine 5'-triphosphate nucleotidohydrolase [Bacilli bacterium]
MRKFEKISFEQFKKDIKDDLELYNSYKLPSRSTKDSAGYDFLAIEDFVLKPGEIIKIPTGIKVTMGNNEVLLLLVRSSMGFKYNVRMCNQVGVIESDYYNNPSNEGHMWIALQNEGNKDFIVKVNEGYAQGIFTTFLVVDDEKLINKERVGGIGSTNQKGDD